MREWLEERLVLESSQTSQATIPVSALLALVAERSTGDRLRDAGFDHFYARQQQHGYGYAVVMRGFRKSVSVILAGFAGLYLMAAVALLITGEFLQIISLVFASGLLLAAWHIWPHQRNTPHHTLQQPESNIKATDLTVSRINGEVPVIGDTSRSVQCSYPIGQCLAGDLASNDFTVIDVETANSSWASICAVGIAQVRAGRVVTTRSWLVHPPAGHEHFDPWNVNLHGITRPRVDHSGRSWPIVLNEMMEAIGSDVIVAHNASFDIGVLQAATDACRLPSPALKYSDSLDLARQNIPDLPDHKLPTVAKACGIHQMRHHDPADDARVCAEITAYLLSGTPPAVTTEEPNQTVPTQAPTADPTHRLYGKSVVITGHLATMSEDDANDQIVNVGGIVRSTVSRKTDYLVEGARTGLEKSPHGSKKRLRALELQSDGHEIQLITETQLQALLDSLE